MAPLPAGTRVRAVVRAGFRDARSEALQLPLDDFALLETAGAPVWVRFRVPLDPAHGLAEARSPIDFLRLTWRS